MSKVIDFKSGYVYKNCPLCSLQLTQNPKFNRILNCKNCAMYLIYNECISLLECMCLPIIKDEELPGKSRVEVSFRFENEKIVPKLYSNVHCNDLETRHVAYKTTKLATMNNHLISIDYLKKIQNKILKLMILF